VLNYNAIVCLQALLTPSGTYSPSSSIFPTLVVTEPVLLWLFSETKALKMNLENPGMSDDVLHMHEDTPIQSMQDTSEPAPQALGDHNLKPDKLGLIPSWNWTQFVWLFQPCSFVC
jgi:hypothetical protein